MVDCAYSWSAAHIIHELLKLVTFNGVVNIRMLLKVGFLLCEPLQNSQLRSVDFCFGNLDIIIHGGWLLRT